MSSHTGFSQILETAYRVDLSADEWQQQVTTALFHLRGGEGILSYEFDASIPRHPVGLGIVKTAGDAEEFRSETGPFHQEMSGAMYQQVVRLGTHSDSIRSRLRHMGMDISGVPPLEHRINELGIYDIWGLWSVNPDAKGIVFAQPLRTEQQSPTIADAQWQRVGIHVAAGYRLRRALGGADPLDHAEAIFRPDGSELHLTEPAISNREALSRAVRSVDRARADEYRRGRPAVLDVWTGLLSGRWSLVDHVDTDGARYTILIRNDPDAEGPKRLSRRETQVAVYAAQGHSNKTIAYELGIRISTVSTVLQRALRKMNLTSRADLIWIYGVLHAG